ncbi:MAG: peptidoglycan-binding protein, partial [Clostridia bacterium]|nr:peptidoglycan-binding protein [Clostridia bacterium]
MSEKNDVSSDALSKYGSRGSEVRKIQQKLSSWGYYDGAVDGIYGTQTKNAVIYFQRKNGL